jgi:2-polyprenyl-3-methyl-5-hydroxy-6-metoxy-1,4-benzoquinol methylase
MKKGSDKILQLGCGNSILQEEMYDDGYKNIMNVDISKAVIDQMTGRAKNRPGLLYKVMDVTDMR